MNVITLTGNLGRDFELNYTGGGIAIGKNSLAVRRDFKDKKTGEYETDWINITVFGQRAETMNQYLGKGSKIGIVGKLQVNQYQNKEGENRTSYDVIVDSFEFLDSRNGNQQNNQQQNPFKNVGTDNDPFEQNDVEIDDSSLPF